MDSTHPESDRTAAFGQPQGSIEALSAEWLSFWFEPWRYLHPSWWALLPLDGINTASDVTLLRLGYRDICERLDLPTLWPEQPGEIEQHQLTRLTGCLPRAHDMLSAFWDDSVPLSQEDRQWVERQRLATALERRFMAHQYDTRGRMTAMWLLLRCLQADFGSSWHRLRLAFPRSWINALEEHNWSAQAVVWGLAVNQRVTRRLSTSLWRHLTTESQFQETATATPTQSANDNDIKGGPEHV